MSLGDEIVLRPRFQKELKISAKRALQLFVDKKKQQKDIIVSQVDDHVFLKIPEQKQHFWSPQLHLEIYDLEEKTYLKGLFGPKPAVWTMFMFFHFVVACLFIAFCIWAYTNASMDRDYHFQLLLAGLMVIGWFVLYTAGRIGKKAGRDEMYQLYNFMKGTIED